MRWKRTMQLLDVHCEGEIGKVAIGGVPKIPGATTADKLAWLNSDPKGQELRRFLCLEPRGNPHRFGQSSPAAVRPCSRCGFHHQQPDQAHAIPARIPSV